MDNIKISIIVPVYQAEKYLNECLESLLHQDIAEYEIICINDGSTDKSAEIIGNLQKKTDKIIYVYQENQGVSAARNRGIEIARGKYLMFVDSDDTIKKNSLKYLYQTAEAKKCEVLVYGGALDMPLKAPEWMRMALYTKNVDYDKFKTEILYSEPGAQPSVCNKLFRYESIGNVKFSPDISVAEDMTFLFVLYPTINKISFVSKRIYLYRISNLASAMHLTQDSRLRYMENHLRAAECIIAAWEKYGLINNDNKNFAQWLTSFLRGPYKELQEAEVKIFLGRIEKLYTSLGVYNLLVLPESQGDNSFSIDRILKIIIRDIKKYGLIGGLENIIFKLFFRR